MSQRALVGSFPAGDNNLAVKLWKQLALCLQPSAKPSGFVGPSVCLEGEEKIKAVEGGGVVTSLGEPFVTSQNYLISWSVCCLGV